MRKTRYSPAQLQERLKQAYGRRPAALVGLKFLARQHEWNKIVLVAINKKGRQTTIVLESTAGGYAHLRKWFKTYWYCPLDLPPLT